MGSFRPLPIQTLLVVQTNPSNCATSSATAPMPLENWAEFPAGSFTIGGNKRQTLARFKAIGLSKFASFQCVQYERISVGPYRLHEIARQRVAGAQIGMHDADRRIEPNSKSRNPAFRLPRQSRRRSLEGVCRIG